MSSNLVRNILAHCFGIVVAVFMLSLVLGMDKELSVLKAALVFPMGVAIWLFVASRLVVHDDEDEPGDDASDDHGDGPQE